MTDIDTSAPVVIFRSQFYPALNAVRSLGRLGVRVYCIDHDPQALGMMSRYCTKRIFWNFDTNTPEASVEFLAKTAREIGERAVLLPMGDLRALFVSKYRDELSKWYLLPQPVPGSLERLYSKLSMYELCKSVGCPTPETLFPESVDQAVRESRDFQYPLVVKAIDVERLEKRSGKRLAIVWKQSDLRGEYEALDEPGFGNLVIQEYIPGEVHDSWVLGAYFGAKGDCLFAMTGKKFRQFPIHGGVTTLAETVSCPEMIEGISKVAKAAGYHGIVGADFRFDRRDGLWKLHDINPRAGANYRLFVDKNGLDVIRALYLDMTGQRIPEAEPDWGRRWLVEDKDLHALRDHLLEKSLSVSAWGRSLRGIDELAHFSWDDLRPSLFFVVQQFQYYARAILRRFSWKTK